MASLTGSTLVDFMGVLVSLIVVIFSYFQWNARFWKRKHVPYIEPNFPFGNRRKIEKITSIVDDVSNIVNEARKNEWKYFGMFLSVKPFFVPLDLELVKFILTKDFNHFADRGVYYNERDDPISAHLFAVGNPKWKRLRTKLSPAFTSGKLRGMFQILVDCGTLLEQTLKDHPITEPIDIKNVLVCFTIDVIGSCAFGLECNSFKESNSPFITYGRKMFRRSFYQRFITIFGTSFPSVARAFRAKLIPGDVSKFFYDIVNKTISYRETNKSRRNDLLQLLIDMKNSESQTTDDDQRPLTMDEIVAQCFAFFLAGFETSSSTVTFALFELSRNVEVQEKVREELVKVLNKYDNKICYDALKEMEYMQQVIDETLRKYPPIPFITRKCLLDYKVPNTDLVLEVGTDVLIPIKTIHYDGNIYEDPEKFNPDRFSAEQKQSRHQYAHIPFGEGPRNCIAMRFGLMQSKVAMTTILRKFRVTLNSKTEVPLVMDPAAFVPNTKGGIWLDIEKV